jgi:2-hydroxy-3-keto-5-methylthiopentenyl-1-phosphate phosphatase
MVFKQKKALVICDFDGTICTLDMGNSVLSHFTKKSWDEIDREYVKGSLGSREAYSKIAPVIATTPEKLRKFVLKKAKIDSSFIKFYRLAQKKGVDVKIVSDGLDFYIRAVLGKYEIDDIEFFTNTIAFDKNNAVSIDFPQMNLLCGRCGTCKNKILNEHRLIYEQIIYVGDGRSDICPSRFADFVFAKDVLLKNCKEEGRAAYAPLLNFGDVARYVKENL